MGWALISWGLSARERSGHIVRHCQVVEAETLIRQGGTFPGPTCSLGGPLCACHLGPPRASLPHLFAVLRRGQQMPSRAKVLGNGAIRGQEALGMSRGLEPLHAIGVVNVLTLLPLLCHHDSDAPLHDAWNTRRGSQICPLLSPLRAPRIPASTVHASVAASGAPRAAPCAVYAPQGSRGHDPRRGAAGQGRGACGLCTPPAGRMRGLWKAAMGT